MWMSGPVLFPIFDFFKSVLPCLSRFLRELFIRGFMSVCQGDCLSALLFIPYLDFAVKPLPSVISAIHYHKPLWSALDWIVHRDVHKITIDPKYADGISFLSSDGLKINQLEREIIAMQKRKSITYKKVKKMLGKNANISNHY